MADITKDNAIMTHRVNSISIILNGIQLERVDDNAAPVLRCGSFDFFDNKIKTKGDEYRYDENGSIIYDANRGITNIEYDMRNNPVLIKFSDGSTTEYVYTAKGEKLRTIHRTSLRRVDVSENDPILCQHVPALEGSSNDFERMPNMYIDSTDYLENFIFENGKIDKFLFSGGCYSYAVGYPARTGGNGGGYYHYLTDHLGNNRAVVNDNDTLEQTIHYYPFGAVYADAGKNPDFQKYKYTGKELDLTHGLNTYDHGARQNYSVLGVWDRVDPLAEKHYNVSPYAFCGNNPIQKVDRNGKWSEFFTTLFYLSITSNSSIQYNKDAKSKIFKWTINVFSQDENGDFIITNYHSFNKSLKENTSKELDKYSQNINELSVAASALGDGAEKGALVTVLEAPEVSALAATIGVTANKVGTVSDFVSKSLKIISSILKGHVDEHEVGDLVYSAFTIGTSKAFQKRLKPLVKELFPNISKKVEDIVYDQIQKSMEDGRK